MIEQFFRPEQLGQALELKASFGNEAVYMGGGPAAMYAAEAMQAWEQFAPA